mmetsp:Transcript_37437/g.101423  ORF Transcript_37437/g.101423 Transcript_37437/m.101423 type:complete len:324 (-) Transcript_37437:75-1046(-)
MGNCECDDGYGKGGCGEGCGCASASGNPPEGLGSGGQAMKGKADVGACAYTKEGRLALAGAIGGGTGRPSVIYECNLRCGCDMNCSRRVVGRGIQAAMEIFRCTPDNTPADLSGDGAQNPFPTTDLGDSVEGWGLRLTQPVKAGTFICEFIGVIAAAAAPAFPSSDVAKSAGQGQTLADLATTDRRIVLVSDWLSPASLAELLEKDAADSPAAGVAASAGGNEDAPVVNGGAAKNSAASGGASTSAAKRSAFADAEKLTIPPLALDARRCGNLARFIRVADAAQGEIPNLVRQAAFTDDRNFHAPRLALFAATDLEVNTELLR